MRLTRTQILAQHLRYINFANSTDATLLADFNISFGQRYQLALAKLANYRTTDEYSFSTSAGTQYYPLPQGEVKIEGMYITVGSVNFPLQLISSRLKWQQLNAIMIQASAVPQFYFPRSYDFGIWPIPQATYTGNLSYYYRDRNLGIDDYTDGTVTVTNGSKELTIAGGTFTPAMVGRWFTITDPTVPGQGYWTRITAYTNASKLILYNSWDNATATTSSYIIGETPDIPEEGHEIFAWGTAADYYAGMQKDPKNAAFYDNMFWTGSPVNGNRIAGDPTVTGGLLGLINNYMSRESVRIVKRKPRLNPLEYKVWATRLM